ncbi:tyrosine-type recombinase/integrase [Haloarcula sp. S1CR25-12]|uniref:Tyrosine-type recombinase/integrase n=1 Tax=Haloarcula saliterrae TaxID=2950534 RepID=A0ABU2F8C8_9EURY|nr:tyrosine-type recombinase/integrase [Haloarcula sp. S1CR25-12]MDS0258525.1 tyrosine-type recombinase/integrase [Haloarcula sp. S1CR25-12]
MSSDTATPDPGEDPIGYFLDDVTYHGKSDRTRAFYERVLREFERYLAGGGHPTPVGTASHRDCMAYVHSLRGTHSESTVATYASYLHRFFAYMTQVGTFESNPMTLVMEEMDESINTDPTRREIGVEAMRSFVATIDHPLERAVVVTLLKTGMRAGELCNLDLRDLHLAEAGPRPDVPVRAGLDGRPDSLYVATEPARGTVVNGEERSASNKRKRDTTVPVDGELARTLRRWLAIRPDVRSDAEPLFVSTSGDWGTRLTPDIVHHLVETHARDHGWYRDGGGTEENVTPHYFRHFFTTHLRDRTGDRGAVKYLRGDVAQDVIDTYTHEWGTRVREIYEANIYSIL